MPSPSSEAVIPTHRYRKSRCRSGVRIRTRRSMKDPPPRWSATVSARLVGRPERRAEQVARGDRLARGGESRALGQRLLQVVERDAQASAQAFDAAVHGLVDAARVFEER